MNINLPATPTGRKLMMKIFLVISLSLVMVNCNKHEEPVLQTPAIEIAGMSDCKNNSSQKALIDTTSNYDCIEYNYQTTGILTLHHINAGFNCCPEMTTEIEVEGNAIVVREIETSAQCNCNCLFDLDLEIRDLSPGEYLIRVIEPYANQNEDELAFTVNLVSAPSGIYCVERHHYPWDTE